MCGALPRVGVRRAASLTPRARVCGVRSRGRAGRRRARVGRRDGVCAACVCVHTGVCAYDAPVVLSGAQGGVYGQGRERAAGPRHVPREPGPQPAAGVHDSRVRTQARVPVCGRNFEYTTYGARASARWRGEGVRVTLAAWRCAVLF